jgi:hypothetical protein
MEFSAAETLLAALVVALGAVLQGSIGFGLALVAAPVLVFLDPRLVPGPLILAGLPFMLVLAWRERGAVDRLAIRVPLAGQFVGILLALALLSLIDGQVLSIVVALVVLLGVALSVSGLDPKLNSRNLLLGGILAGFMGTTSSMPGPALALIHQHVSPARMRATLAPFFVLGSLVSLVGLVWTGQMGRDGMAMGLVLVVPALLGLAISSWTAPRVRESAVRPAVLVFAFIAALGLLYRSF